MELYTTNDLRDTVWEWRLREQTIEFSPRWNATAGYNKLLIKNAYNYWYDLIYPDDYMNFRDEFIKHLESHSGFFEVQVRMKIAAGTYKWFLIHGAARFDDNGFPVAVAGSVSDIAYQKELEKKLEYLNNYDPLTGFPNRKHVTNILNETIFRKNEYKLSGAAIFIDIDGFRKINDVYGFQAGSELLNYIGQKLKEYTRESDIISRINGDEFLIFLPDIKDKKGVTNFADRILDIFKLPIYVLGKEFFITASIGIVLYPGGSSNVSDLMKKGDSAVYSAKTQGKNQYQFYQKTTSEELAYRFGIENDLRNAVERSEFVPFFQPIIEAKTGKLRGLEALIRWQHPQKGIVNPSEFINVAEETGLIVPIGNWMLEAVCTRVKEWQNKGYPSIRAAVNISAQQFKQKDFPDTISSILEKTGLKPQFLELELTESALMESMETAAKTITRLKSIGIKVSLDDFGTFYSSLSYLKHLPIDKIKIDKSFIGDIGKNSKTEAIISAIIVMAQKMGLEIVAEGVENYEQLNYLVEQECELIQGYLYGKPVSAVQTEDIVKKAEILLDSQYFNFYNI